MGAVIFLGIAAAFVGFRIWLITKRSQRTNEHPPWMQRFRSPGVAEIVAFVAAGGLAALVVLDLIPQWLGVIVIVAVVLTRMLVQRARR